MLSEEVYKELEDALGPENVSREPVVLDGYAWQPLWNMGPEFWTPRPEAVVLPGSTEDVQAVVRACNKHGLKFKAFSTGWGAIGAPGEEGVIQLDLRRMDRILELDEKNMYMVVEPHAIGGVMRAEAMKRGLTTHMITAGAHSSPLASATSAWGCAYDGLVTSWSGRNLLGVEWVLPTGDVLEVGTPGSGCGWFLGDGPGPSLRGIIRGRCGAFGGNGVFTKAALKLFPWPGPNMQEVDGLMFDADPHFPADRYRVILTIARDRESYTRIVQEMAQEGIGFIATKFALGVIFGVLLPHMMKKKAYHEGESFRTAMKSIRHNYVMALTTSTPEELDFQLAFIREVVADNRGVVIDLGDLRVSDGIAWPCIGGSMPGMAFRTGGMMHIGWGQDEAHAAEVRAQRDGEAIKEAYVARGDLLDDLGDTSFHFFCEEGGIGHYEECWWFDHRNKQHAEAIWPIEVDYTTLHVEHCLESGLDADPVIRKLFSPLQGNYNQYNKKLRGAFDPNGAADPTLYTAEADLPAEAVERAGAAKVERLRRLVARKTWTESGPPA